MRSFQRAQGMREAAPEQQEVAASTPDERRKKKLIEEALSSLGSCRPRCCKLLVGAASRATLIELRCLDFLEKELSFIVAGLTALSPQHVDQEMIRWLRVLTNMASGPLARALGEADPQHHNTLLRRPARFFRGRHPNPISLLDAARIFYGLDEDPKRLLRATSRHGLPQQADEHY